MTEAEGKPATLPGRTAERISVFTDAVFVWWAPWAQIPWAFTGLVGTLVHRAYRGGGRPRPRIRPS
ncbi:MAG TPA: hypothetical protein VGI96_13960 [Streptosporangiaceae bacterium]|jgi:hypothetical protein